MAYNRLRVHLVLEHLYCQRERFHHLVWPDPRPATSRALGERQTTMPTVLRQHRHDLIPLLDAVGRAHRAEWHLPRADGRPGAVRRAGAAAASVAPPIYH